MSMYCQETENIENKKEDPLVTVVLPVYNRENTILRAINSVLEQTYTNIEIIVVDDCSTDATIDRIKSCQDNRVELLCLSKNKGANFARNRGIEKARGSFIAFQDSDDEWLPEKLAKQISFMIENNIEASFCPYILHQGQERQIIPCDYLEKDYYGDNLICRLKKGNVVGTPTLILRKEIFSQIGMFDEQMRRLQDYELVIRLVQKYELGFINMPLVNAYRMEQSIISDRDALLDAHIKLLEKHIDFMELDYIINEYIDNSTFLTDGTLNWQEFNKIIEAVRKSRCPELENKCYQLAMEYLNKQIFLIKEMLKEWYVFFNKNLEDGEFAIYGAGVYGHKVYCELKNKNHLPRFFLVTKQGETKEIDGIPVLSLDEHINKDMPIIIAVSWDKQKELINNLLNRDIYKFCVYPFCL